MLLKAPTRSALRAPIGPAIPSFGADSGPQLPIPESGLLSMLDGSVAASFFSDLAKTSNSIEGGAVAVWADQSGNGNDWLQSNASFRPLAHLSAGRLYNNGSGDQAESANLVGPDISAWTRGSFFARVQNVSGPQGMIWGVTAWDDINSGAHWSYSANEGTHYITFGATGRSSFAWSSVPESSIALMTYEENVNALGVVKAFINGTQRFSADLGDTSFRSDPRLGCGIRANVANFSGGFHYYKCCMYDRIVTANERAEINAWLES